MRFISVILLALVAVITADNPLPLDAEDVQTSNTADDLDYRLPEHLDPIHYDVEITPYFKEGGARDFSFDGIVQITFRVQTPGLTSFLIHQRVKEIQTVVLRAEAAPNVVINTNFEPIDAKQFLRVSLLTGVLTNGATYILRVEYIGNINATPLERGVFRGNYIDKTGTERWYLATHLQPTHSRQAFPSFDEPGFKSTFRITINRPLSFSKSFSNMPMASSSGPTTNNREKEVFRVTPRMSAYLVSFHVHEGFEVIAEHDVAARPYRILARHTAEGQGDYALKVGPPLTDWLSNYFKIDYYAMEPTMKNDQIASPFWASGATENWGLVTYRELRLLYEEGETNEVDKLAIGTITAHELAHKWFGNLITCKWWDNVWINEGFASYFEYFAMHGAYPELQLADQFNIMYVQSALSADSASSTRSLQHTVNSPSQVTDHFSGISYSKGASLLLMLRHLVRDSTFEKALNYFLTARANKYAVPSDLYENFAKAVAEDKAAGGTFPDFDITSFMKYWVEEQGYPVLKVTVDSQNGRINLEQNRFFVNAGTTPTAQAWPLPLTYTTASNPNWVNLQATKVMTTKEDSIETAAGNGWVIFNVQQKNIYRVNYDENNWKLIADALNADYTTIHHLNRAQIVDDVFALMRSEQLSYELGFRVLEFLKKDTSYYSWYPAISGFSWLRNRFRHLPESLDAFDKILYDYLEAVIADLGYDVVPNEHLTRTLNRFYVLSFACNIRHKGCVDDAVAKFRNYYTNAEQNSINPNLRRHVFCEGLRAGGLSEWSFLNNRRQKSNNQADDLVMLRALGCTTNDEARQQFLLNILEDDIVKAQDRVNALNWFNMGDRSNAKFALEFLKPRARAIQEAVVLPAWFNNVLSNIASNLESDSLNDMKEWIEANKGEIPALANGLGAISSAEASIKWGSDNADRIIEAAAPTPPDSESTTTDSTTTDPTTTDPTTTDPTITDPTTTDSSTSDPTTPETESSPTEPPTAEPSTEEPTSESTSTTTEAATTPDPNSATIYMPTTMLMLWTALAMLLK